MRSALRILALSALALAPATAGDPPVDLASKQSLLDYPPPPSDSPWAFELNPYFWFANLKGSVGVGGATSSVDIGIDDIFDNLDFAFASSGGVRYEQFGLFADFLYLKITPSFEQPGPLFGRTDLSLEDTIVDLKASYRVLESDHGWLEVLAGARYRKIDMSLTLQPGLLPRQSASGTEDWWDAVGGLRGRYNLSDRLFLTALADVGGGSSDITWQALGGMGYQINELMHFTAGYRYMDYDYESDDFLFDLNTRGAYIELGMQW